MPNINNSPIKQNKKTRNSVHYQYKNRFSIPSNAYKVLPQVFNTLINFKYLIFFLRPNSQNRACGRRDIEISTSHTHRRARAHTHTHTHTHRVALLRTNDQLVTEAVTYTAQNKHKRQHIHSISVI